MNTKPVSEEKVVNNIYNDISALIDDARRKVYYTANSEMLYIYWKIGEIIVRIQDGNERASYGDNIINILSQMLAAKYGNGFSVENLRRMRKFYSTFPNYKLINLHLNWSHYLILLRINNEKKRNFYFNECINSNWSVRELQRQINSLLYERLISNANTDKILELAEKGHEIKETKDIIKDPLVLEFLDLKDNDKYHEYDLEKNILEHLKEFLLELGKGFTFVGSQVKITIGNDQFYPDLVFYNRILQCFVIFDLKIGKVTHQDIGQMQMYVNYYDREVKNENENKTVGILLCTNKNETVVKYTLPEDNATIFAAEYMLHLPTEKELIKTIEDEKVYLETINKK